MSHQELARQVGVPGAVMMGLGSIIGTGVFVSIGIAAGAAGPSVVLALAVAALVATCNGLASAQLAANHPVSGGTYEYGYRWLTPSLGFAAGWLFLCAKTASAATAALGFAGYVLNAAGVEGIGWQVPLALAGVAVLTLLVLAGIRLSSTVNIAIVSITLLSLLFFVLAGLPTALQAGTSNLTPFFHPASDFRSLQDFGSLGGLGGFLEACALMFVAYTGYGRIATLGEEIHNPYVNIPRAIIVTLAVSMLLYVAVGLVGIAAVGAEMFATAGTVHAAPLEIVAGEFGVPGAGLILAVGAVTAMLGVLLNLILGLSRVLLAMGRRNDMPPLVGKLSSACPTEKTGSTHPTPYIAVIVVGLLIAGLVLVGNVKTTWSFSAFTVLIYYALTNLAALRLQAAERMYPRFITWLGLIACLFLAFWVEWRIWVAGLGLLALGMVWHMAAQKWATRV